MSNKPSRRSVLGMIAAIPAAMVGLVVQRPKQAEAQASRPKWTDEMRNDTIAFHVAALSASYAKGGFCIPGTDDEKCRLEMLAMWILDDTSVKLCHRHGDDANRQYTDFLAKSFQLFPDRFSWLNMGADGIFTLTRDTIQIEEAKPKRMEAVAVGPVEFC